MLEVTFDFNIKNADIYIPYLKYTKSNGYLKIYTIFIE